MKQLCSQMKRDCIEHLQKEYYMLVVGLYAEEMLGVPLYGGQSHSAYRRESIKDTAEAVAKTTQKKGQHIYLLIRSQGKAGFNASRKQL